MGRYTSRTEKNEVQPSVMFMLTLALVTLTATCAKVCFSPMADVEKHQQEAQVG
jgi:hypothetical protein